MTRIRLKPRTERDPQRRPLTSLDDPDRADVFDPALKQYREAFIKGPPRDSDVACRLAETRSSLLRASLVALACSVVRDALVLRGSLTLEAWFGRRARRAKDMDLVVRDPSCPPDGDVATGILLGVADAVRAALADADVHVPGADIPVDRIWTYERAEGRRLAVPWTFAGSTRETIQVDVVFRETIQDAPRLEPVSDPRGVPYRGHVPHLWFASREESLAWKVLWLDTDFHPQGKDVYDAVLLAEDGPLSLRMLERVYAAKSQTWRHGTNANFLEDAAIDWEGFSRESPALVGRGGATWVRRFAEVLRFVE
jgi:hypothetical protein